MMGVSRTSLREALREVEADGLVTTRPNRGPIVAPLSPETVESLYQVRAMLEGLAARLFARQASDAQIESIKRVVDAIARAYRQGDAKAALRAKGEFHRILLEGAGNEIAASMLRTVRLRISQLQSASLSHPGRKNASIRGLRKLVAAFEARDEDAAWRACIAHVEGAASAALAVLAARAADAAAARGR
jgi:DNA-binding GntR family transcriptional regulator